MATGGGLAKAGCGAGVKEVGPWERQEDPAVLYLVGGPALPAAGRAVR